MRASIIVSAFLIFFASIATAVVAWNQQQNSQIEQTVIEERVIEETGNNEPETSASILPDLDPASQSAQPPTATDQSIAAGKPRTQPTEQMLEEIEAIRRQLGIDLFPDDPPGADDQQPSQEFRNALKSVLEKESGVDRAASTRRLAPAGHQNTSAPLPMQKSTLPEKLTDSLQEAILVLEQRAALLEEQRQYQASDRSRRLAHKLRKEIRTIQQDASP